MRDYADAAARGAATGFAATDRYKLGHQLDDGWPTARELKDAALAAVIVAKVAITRSLGVRV